MLPIRFCATALVALVNIGQLASPAPDAGYHWKSVGWGGGGLYWSAAFHPKKDGVLYMGGDVVGVYKSADHGLTWQLCNDGIAGYEVLSLAVDPTAPERIYASTSQGISRSEDGAKHWTTLTASLSNRDNLRVQKDRSVHALAIDPRNGRRLAFASPDGRVLESLDFGATWLTRYRAKVASSVIFHPMTGTLYAATADGLWSQSKLLTKVSSTAVVFSSDGRVGYAATKLGVSRSGDGGKTWSLTSGRLNQGEAAHDVVVDQRKPDNVWCITSAGWGGAVAWSKDAGRTWIRVQKVRADATWNPTDVEAVKAGLVDLSSPKCLAVNPNNGKELFIAANWRPYHSGDGGHTWQERSRGADISVVTDVQFLGHRTYVTAMDEGVFVSDDSKLGWRQLFPLRWTKEASGHHWRIQVWDDGKQILTTGSPWDNPINLAFRSLDGGATFIPVQDGLPKNIPTTDSMWGRGYPRALASDPNNPFTVYLGIDGEPDGGVFKSIDGGWHWQRLPAQPSSFRMFYGLVVDPTDSKRLFWASCGEKGGLYRSDDEGISWKKVFSQETWLFNVLVGRDGTVFAPGKDLWRSRDHGATWNQITDQKSETHIVGLATDPENPKRLWFSRTSWDGVPRGGVFETTDGGNTWKEISGDVPNRNPLVLRYNAAKHELWAAGPGLFVLPRP